MSKLEQLINELCPKGVEYELLGNVCNLSAGGDVPKDRFSKEKTENYTVPIYSNGIGDNALYGYTDLAKIEKRCVTIAARGTIGYPSLRKESFYPIIRLICAIPKGNITADFLYYVIEATTFQVPTSGIPQLTIPMISKYKVPMPPLPVQEEIVRILDNFTELTTELAAELAARKKQYEYYRNSLLTFGDEEFEWKTLGAITNLSRGVRVVRSQLNRQGKYPVYQNSMIPLGYFNQCNCQAQTTFIISAGAAGSVGYSDVDFWAADDCYCLVCPENLDSRYLYHTLTNQQDYIFSQVRKASVPRIGRDIVKRIKIPIPYPNDIDKSLKEQQRIVDILDRFDTLCNDISSGLPAEIEARQQQYEYYRDKLLTFPKVKLEV